MLGSHLIAWSLLLSFGAGESPDAKPVQGDDTRKRIAETLKVLENRDTEPDAIGNALDNTCEIGRGHPEVVIEEVLKLKVEHGERLLTLEWFLHSDLRAYESDMARIFATTTSPRVRFVIGQLIASFPSICFRNHGICKDACRLLQSAEPTGTGGGGAKKGDTWMWNMGLTTYMLPRILENCECPEAVGALLSVARDPGGAIPEGGGPFLENLLLRYVRFPLDAAHGVDELDASQWRENWRAYWDGVRNRDMESIVNENFGRLIESAEAALLTDRDSRIDCCLWFRAIERWCTRTGVDFRLECTVEGNDVVLSRPLAPEPWGWYDESAKKTVRNARRLWFDLDFRNKTRKEWVALGLRSAINVLRTSGNIAGRVGNDKAVYRALSTVVAFLNAPSTRDCRMNSCGSYDGGAVRMILEEWEKASATMVWNPEKIQFEVK